MSDQEIIKRFNDCAKNYFERYYGDQALGPQSYPQAVIRRQYLFDMLKVKGGNFLDVGCGVGNIAYDFYLLGFNAWGIDVSSQMIEEAKKRMPKTTQKAADDQPATWSAPASNQDGEVKNGPSLVFDCGDFLEKEYPDNFFDCVAALGFIEYVNSPAMVMEKISRITKKGGEVFITVPLNSCLYKKIKKPKKEQKTGNFAYHYFSFRDLDKLCERHGLIKKDFRFFHFFVIPPFLDQILNKLIGPDKVVLFNQRFEKLSRRVWGRFLAGGYLIKAVKS